MHDKGHDISHILFALWQSKLPLIGLFQSDIVTFVLVMNITDTLLVDVKLLSIYQSVQLLYLKAFFFHRFYFKNNSRKPYLVVSFNMSWKDISKLLKY